LWRRKCERTNAERKSSARAETTQNANKRTTCYTVRESHASSRHTQGQRRIERTRQGWDSHQRHRPRWQWSTGTAASPACACNANCGNIK
jgi:hypothetical protein